MLASGAPFPVRVMDDKFESWMASQMVLPEAAIKDAMALNGDGGDFAFELTISKVEDDDEV